MKLSIIQIICYFILVQIEFLFNLILFIFMYAYRSIKKLTTKEETMLEKIKRCLLNNKVNIIHNLLFIFCNFSGPYFPALACVTLSALVYRGERAAVLNAITLIIKTLYLTVTNQI